MFTEIHVNDRYIVVFDPLPLLGKYQPVFGVAALVGFVGLVWFFHFWNRQCRP